MLTFSKKLLWNGTAGETDLWREMNFVTSAELYTDGPPHREYLCLVPTPLHELTNSCGIVCACGQWRPCCGDSCSSSSTCQRVKSSYIAWELRPRRKIHSHPGYNDLVPDQHGGKILPSFIIILIVNKWFVMIPRCTTTFHSDGLVN